MRIGICEDDLPVAQKLAQKTRAFFSEQGYPCDVQIFADGGTLLGYAYGFDLVFLDCRLPDGNGLDVARRLNEKADPPMIVFVSAYREYVFESFEVGTFRYLLKPIDDEVLNKTLDSFMRYYDRDTVIGIPTKEQNRFLNLSDIVYIESNGKHSIVRFVGSGQTDCLYYDSTRPLAEFAEIIRSPRFFRTHKSFLVNLRYIEKIEAGKITLTVGEQVELSRRNMKAFHRVYNNYLKKAL